MSRPYSDNQSSYGQRYNGDYDTHAAHYNSVKELKHFGVSTSKYEDNDANYHNANEFTNLSVHNRIDKLLLDSHSNRAAEINGFSYTSGGEQVYVSPQEMADRVYHKIDAAKATGAMDNERYQNYLKKSAERLNMDMRAFNGC